MSTTITDRDQVGFMIDTARATWEAHGFGPNYDRSKREYAGDVVYFGTDGRWADMVWAYAKLEVACLITDGTATWADVQRVANHYWTKLTGDTSERWPVR